ncbi:MAG: hypothetical protein WCH34_13380 [Bacteroidota bacterium]
MASKYYLPYTYLGLVAWLFNFYTKLSNYKTLFGLTDPQIESFENDYKALQNAEQIDALTQAKAEDITHYKHTLTKGVSNGSVVNPPVPDVFPVLTDAVEPGIEKRITSMVRTIKAHKKYKPEIGRDLGIIGAEIVIDLVELEPSLKLKSSNVDGITIKYTLKGMKNANIYVQVLSPGQQVSDKSINEADWELLSKVEGNEFKDTRLNVVKAPETRIYKVILTKKNKLVGKFSNYLRVVAEVYMDQQGNEMSGKAAPEPAPTPTPSA